MHFRDQCSHTFNLKCFYQIPLMWWKTYVGKLQVRSDLMGAKMKVAYLVHVDTNTYFYNRIYWIALGLESLCKSKICTNVCNCTDWSWDRRKQFSKCLKWHVNASTYHKLPEFKQITYSIFIRCFELQNDLCKFV